MPAAVVIIGKSFGSVAAATSTALYPAIEAMEDSASMDCARVMRGTNSIEKSVAMENRLYPLRELYGDLLFEMGQAPAALVEYETALKATPNRYRGYLGVARAADAAGNRAKAFEYFGKLVELAKNADAERQEIREAKAFLAQR